MKNEIYTEIKILENSHNEFQKIKGRIIRIIADNINCFKCIDTKRTWKNRDNLTMSTLDGKGKYDILGCPKCNNVGWICNANTNNLTHNGFKLFSLDNNNWRERFEEMHNKGSGDIYVMNSANKWKKNINESKNDSFHSIKKEPLKMESITYEPFKIESITNELFKKEAIKTELDKVEPFKMESIIYEPFKMESITNELFKKEAIKTELDKVEPIEMEPVKTEFAKTELLNIDLPLFEVCKRITKNYVEKSLDVNIEIGTIVNIITNVVKVYFGNVFSLLDLAKELRISFSISNTKSVTNDKLIKIKDNNYLGIKTCTKITQKMIKTGLFGKNKLANEYSADIFILKPLNQKAVEKSLMIMGKIGEEITNDILKEF